MILSDVPSPNGAPQTRFDDDESPDDKNTFNFGMLLGILFGLCFGMFIWIIFDDYVFVSLGIAYGFTIGSIVDYMRCRRTMSNDPYLQIVKSVTLSAIIGIILGSIGGLVLGTILWLISGNSSFFSLSISISTTIGLVLSVLIVYLIKLHPIVKKKVRESKFKKMSE